MLRLRFLNDAQPRSKNGQPPQSTTGVARANWSHIEARTGSGCQPNSSPPMARITSGTESAALIQKRRDMSISSGLGPSSSVGSTGSSAMPQIGQLPGAGTPDLRMHRAGPDGILVRFDLPVSQHHAGRSIISMAGIVR